jgi:2-phosphosulfolactate phosphatase
MNIHPERKLPIEVCLTPALWHLYNTGGAVIIVTDIFRASTSMVTAFQTGVRSIIPVAEISESLSYKEKGYIIAGERDGKKLEFADFGNSPYNFMDPALIGKTVVMNTTNGTQVLKMVQGNNNITGIGAFTNLAAICEWAVQQDRPVIIFCAGWKNRFSLEDTLFAGAAVEYLLQNYSEKFFTHCDSSHASFDLWQTAKSNLRKYIDKAAHRHRLKKMGLDDIIDYSLQLNISHCIPVLQEDEIFDMKM